VPKLLLAMQDAAAAPGRRRGIRRSHSTASFSTFQRGPRGMEVGKQCPSRYPVWRCGRLKNRHPGEVG
jgi:hypothetical protein